VILSLAVQVLLDHARLSPGLCWSARVAAPLAAILVSGGFFTLAHAPQLRVVLYVGATLVALATATTGVGLLLSLRGRAAG
jgi:membrane protease YdiL (CAAX protease family)